MPGRQTASDELPTTLVQIGEVARRTDLSIRTIRHWEEVGLVTPSARSAGGFRLYSEDDIARVRLLRYMKPLDLTLEQMRELLAVRGRLTAVAADPVERTEALVWPAGAGPGDGGDELTEVVAILDGYAERAERRLGKLRGQVREVEEFIARLRQEIGTGSRRG